MPLSIDKLNQLLEKKGFMCRKFFIDQHYCRFIEILSINTIDSYSLYIPSKYKFEPRVSDKHNQYKIKAIPIIKPENLEEIFPWESFYGGTQVDYINKEEGVAGCYGM